MNVSIEREGNLMQINIVIWGFASLISFCTLTQAGQYGAHVHGAAGLTLAIEDSAVEMMFNFPAISIVGFESKAATPDQLEAVERAKLKLNDPASFFTLTGGECNLSDATIDFSAILDVSSDDYAHGGDGDHDAHHEDHDVHHEEQNLLDGDESHSDINVRYRFVCLDSSAIESLKFGPTGLPFSLETISIMWVSERGQGAGKVTPDQLFLEVN